MTENQAGEEATTGSGQGKASAAEAVARKRDLDLTDKGTKDSSKRECYNTHVVDFKALLFGLLGFFCLNNELCSFFFHVSLGKLGDDLNEENNTDNTEDVSNTVTNRNKTRVLFSNGSLCRRESGGGGQGAGKQTNDHSNEAILILDRGAVADEFACVDASGSSKTTRKDDDYAEQNVGLEVSLEVAKELGTCNVTNRGNEEDKTEAFDERKTGIKVIRLAGPVKYELTECVYFKEECADDESNDEYAGIAKGNSLDGDSAEEITKEQNGENHKQKCGDITDRDQTVKKCHFLRLIFS